MFMVHHRLHNRNDIFLCTSLCARSPTEKTLITTDFKGSIGAPKAAETIRKMDPQY